MTHRIRFRALAAATCLSLMLGSCGGDSPTEPPDPTIVASIVMGTALDTLVSLTETAQLTATARNAAGAPVNTATITWSSNNAAAATVSGTGLVTAVSNGTTVVRAASGGFEATATIVVRQVGASIEVLDGESQGATVGTPLDTNPVFLVKDALGHVVPSAEVAFTAAGNGSTDPAVATTAADGTASTAWTLATAAGVQELEAKVALNPAATLTLAAIGLASDPATIALVDGDDQTELPTLPLPQPLRVRVLDVYGNAIAGLAVVFAAQDGTLDSTDVLTDLEGIAATTWTLGDGEGEHLASAVLPDSAIGEGVVVTGGPVAFSAQAVAFAVADLGAAVSGEAVTVTGTGFAPDPAQHSVTVDGVEAPITGGTQGSLTFTVPSFGCVPARARTVVVSRGAHSGSLVRAVAPEGQLALAPGERVILDGGAGDCLQLPASVGTDEEYLVGLTSTRAINAELPFRLIADDGSGGPPLLRDGSTGATGATAMPAEPSRVGRHRAMREWEARFFSRPRVPRARLTDGIGRVGARAAAVGDMIPVRVPGMLTDACNDYSEVTARVLAVGPRVTVASDASLPIDPASAAAITVAVNALVTQVGDVLYAAASEHFGLPPDLDADERVTLLFTPAAIATGVLAFSSAVDAIDRATCPASNEGEVIYVAMAAAPTAPDVATTFAASAPHLAHELIHVVQSRRIAAGGVALATWLAEGQAELGAEIIAFLTAGLNARSDLGSAALGGAIGASWLAPRFDRLSSLFGWDGATDRHPGAPERCSLFGYGGLGVPCNDDYAAGAAWSFMRFIVDRIATASAAGEDTFLRALIDQAPASDGSALLASLSGSSLDELMVEWAMALYTDGRLPAGAAPALRFPSWDLAAVFDAMPAEKRLDPVSRGFVAFDDERSVIGGGTAYTRISAAGAHGGLSLRVRDAAGNQLAAAMQPRLWVVRVR